MQEEPDITDTHKLAPTATPNLASRVKFNQETLSTEIPKPTRLVQQTCNFSHTPKT